MEDNKSANTLKRSTPIIMSVCSPPPISYFNFVTKHAGIKVKLISNNFDNMMQININMYILIMAFCKMSEGRKMSRVDDYRYLISRFLFSDKIFHIIYVDTNSLNIRTLIIDD